MPWPEATSEAKPNQDTQSLAPSLCSPMVTARTRPRVAWNHKRSLQAGLSSHQSTSRAGAINVANDAKAGVIFRRGRRQADDGPRSRGKSLSHQDGGDDGFVDIGTGAPLDMIPDLFLEPNGVRDGLATKTSLLQDKTVRACLSLLSGEDERLEYNEHGIPRLRREQHLQYLRTTLRDLPGSNHFQDTVRSWILYWSLTAMAILGEDVSAYRTGIVETVASMQNPTGGFSAGNGQVSHLGSTYAAVLALALVGGDEAYNVVDRRAMRRWLCSLKQPDGGFQLSLGGEKDVR